MWSRAAVVVEGEDAEPAVSDVDIVGRGFGMYMAMNMW